MACSQLRCLHCAHLLTRTPSVSFIRESTGPHLPQALSFHLNVRFCSTPALCGFRQRQHGFDVHFDCSFYDQAGNSCQLIAVRLLAEENPRAPNGECRNQNAVFVLFSLRSSFCNRFKIAHFEQRFLVQSQKPAGEDYCSHAARIFPGLGTARSVGVHRASAA